MGNERSPSSISLVLQALQKNKIRYIIAGMSAAVIQGAPVTTLDTDIWVDYPSRAYLRILEICKVLGGESLAPTVSAFSDGTMINFLYSIDGLGTFDREYKKTVKKRWQGITVPLLPLTRILKSKQFIAREKDLAHIPLLKQTIKLTKRTK